MTSWNTCLAASLDSPDKVSVSATCPGAAPACRPHIKEGPCSVTDPVTHSHRWDTSMSSKGRVGPATSCARLSVEGKRGAPCSRIIQRVTKQQLNIKPRVRTFHSWGDCTGQSPIKPALRSGCPPGESRRGAPSTGGAMQSGEAP